MGFPSFFLNIWLVIQNNKYIVCYASQWVVCSVWFTRDCPRLLNVWWDIFNLPFPPSPLCLFSFRILLPRHSLISNEILELPTTWSRGFRTTTINHNSTDNFLKVCYTSEILNFYTYIYYQSYDSYFSNLESEDLLINNLMITFHFSLIFFYFFTFNAKIWG